MYADNQFSLCLKVKRGFGIKGKVQLSRVRLSGYMISKLNRLSNGTRGSTSFNIVQHVFLQ